MQAGVDEAGRGAWAGPLVSAAVVLTDTAFSKFLNDSKQLSRSKREAIFNDILSSCDVGIGIVSAVEIDKNGLTWAQKNTMQHAVDSLSSNFNHIIIDGSVKYIDDERAQTMVKADQKVPEVMAASIVAKVYRDNLMELADSIWPEYGFSSHVGYGTAKHSQALQIYGPCQIHRASYKPIQKYM